MVRSRDPCLFACDFHLRLHRSASGVLRAHTAKQCYLDGSVQLGQAEDKTSQHDTSTVSLRETEALGTVTLHKQHSRGIGLDERLIG